MKQVKNSVFPSHTAFILTQSGTSFEVRQEVKIIVRSQTFLTISPVRVMLFDALDSERQ